MRRTCTCAAPLPSKNPRSLTTCNSCGFWVDPELLNLDRHVAEFFDRLAEALFPYDKFTGDLITAPWWDDFREHVVMRELAGREKFGLSYLERDNPAEAAEEATDLALYMLLDGIRAKRDGIDPEEDVALTAAYHAAQAHRYARMIVAKRGGNTGPGLDE